MKQTLLKKTSYCQAIKDTLDINCEIEYNFDLLEKENEAKCVYNFKMF